MTGPLKLGAALAAGLALATGCGGGNGDSTGGSETATASSALGRCRAQDVRAHAGPGNGATGHIVAPFGIRNAAARPCLLRGFPRVTPLGRRGSPIGVAVKPRSADFFGQVPVRTVPLEPGGHASFRLTFEDAIKGGNCPTAQSARLTWRGSAGAIVIRLRGQLVCPGGVTVSPFATGRSAWSPG